MGILNWPFKASPWAILTSQPCLNRLTALIFVKVWSANSSTQAQSKCSSIRRWSSCCFVWMLLETLGSSSTWYVPEVSWFPRMLVCWFRKMMQPHELAKRCPQNQEWSRGPKKGGKKGEIIDTQKEFVIPDGVTSVI